MLHERVLFIASVSVNAPRVEAANRIKLVPVGAGITRVHTDEIEQRLLRLAVNRLGTWYIAELEAESKKLVIADAPIEISGFGSDEIDQILIGTNEDGCEVGDLHPEVSAIARVGDLFLLGSDRLICGDERDGDRVRLITRGGYDWSKHYPWIVESALRWWRTWRHRWAR